MAAVFISGGTGYVGTRLIPKLLAAGHTVRALARRGSGRKLPAGCEVVEGDALEASSFAGRVAPSDTFVHLVGVAHPAPWKGAQFRAVDLVALRASVEAAASAGIRHFVYVSVAHPAPVMKDYIAVRSECELILRGARIPATILRPWYVLGPGHRWPYALLPFYKLAELIPRARQSALRLGLVTLEEMTGALAWAVGHPCQGMRALEVPAIRAMAKA